MRRMVTTGAFAWLAILGAAHAQTVPDVFDPPEGEPVTWRITQDPPVNFRTAHVILLPKRAAPRGDHDPDGVEIVLIEKAWAGGTSFHMEPGPVPAARLQFPTEMTVAPLDEAEDYLFCSGHTTLPNGTLFVAGGGQGEFTELGLHYAMTFNPGLDGKRREWRRVPQDMVGLGEGGRPFRWYPTTTALADGRILVTGGYERWFGDPWLINRSIEAYSTRSGWQLLSAHLESPAEIFNSHYTHVFQLPRSVAGFDILMFGERGRPFLMSSRPAASPRWGPPNLALRPGTGTETEMASHGGSTALLPIRLVDGEWGYANGSVLVSGGARGTSHEYSVDIYDPVANAWRSPRLRMEIDGVPVRRTHSATVLLPDGKVLVLLGENEEDQSFGVQRAHYVDPRDGFTITPGASEMGEVRGYHSVAVLLPSGRVLVGSGVPVEGWPHPEQENFRYYDPWYMSRPRPVIKSAPRRLAYGRPFEVSVQGGPLREAVLIRLGSMTHSFDMSQRHVQLQIVFQAPGIARLKVPQDARTAPAGYYMLFVLDARFVPSVAKVVKVSQFTNRTHRQLLSLP